MTDDAHRTLDNAAATIVDALNASPLIDSATTQPGDPGSVRLRVAGRLSSDEHARFTVEMDVH